MIDTIKSHGEVCKKGTASATCVKMFPPFFNLRPFVNLGIGTSVLELELELEMKLELILQTPLLPVP